MKNELVGIILVFTLVAIVFAGCTRGKDEGDNEEKIPKGLPAGLYTYELEVNTSEKDNYTVYLPIPILKNNSAFSAMNNISTIKGKATINIIDTKYGKALEIKSNENIHVKANINGCTSVPLSMFSHVINETSGPIEFYWIFCNFTKNNTQLSINLKSESDNWAVDNAGELIRKTSWECITINTSITVIDWQQNEALHKFFFSD